MCQDPYNISEEPSYRIMSASGGAVFIGFESTSKKLAMMQKKINPTI